MNGSEMPKGVEHSSGLTTDAFVTSVNGSEMPKGVEHTTKNWIYLFVAV